MLTNTKQSVLPILIKIGVDKKRCIGDTLFTVLSLQGIGKVTHENGGSQVVWGVHIREVGKPPWFLQV